MRLEAPESPTHTVKFYSNWDGEGDIVWVLAFKVGDEFYYWECGRCVGMPLIEYKGDEILASWELS